MGRDLKALIAIEIADWDARVSSFLMYMKGVRRIECYLILLAVTLFHLGPFFSILIVGFHDQVR